MICERCFKEFDANKAKLNVAIYGKSAFMACPHCGKPYYVSREVKIHITPIEISGKVEDDWGLKMVNDKEYYNSISQ